MVKISLGILSALLMFNLSAQIGSVDEAQRQAGKKAEPIGEFYESWSQQVNYAVVRAIEYWSPKVKIIYKQTHNYWAADVERLSVRTLEYWTPILSPVYGRTKSFWSKEFQSSIHPSVIRYYQWYYEKYGKSVSTHLNRSMNYLEPKLFEVYVYTLSYYQNNHPITLQFLSDIPAFVKKSYEKFILSVWVMLSEVEDSEFESIDNSQRVPVDLIRVIARSLNNSNISEEEKRLNILFQQIRSFGFDSGMQDCYKIKVFQLPIVNAVNTGCHIFVSEPLLDLVGESDDELVALMAHEMAHADQGHNMKTFFSLASAGVSHTAKMSMENLLWLATGEMSDYGNKTERSDHLSMVMEKFSFEAPLLEIAADQRAVMILNRAGISAKSLIQLLKRLHHADEGVQCSEKSKGGRLLEGSMTVRKYPVLCDRILAIEEVAKF
ncbi:MAG: M48 family metalloprotease [Bdellovibrionaceae bacterium]|jgi:hypothetical protein|nr:M48 family metalloprotease [Pseudobdellovibrionaceae bacterium]